MDTIYQNSETGCCPRFFPEPWQEKEITLSGKLFLKARVKSIFHIPVNFGKVVVKNLEKIQAAAALVEEPLMLVDENSLWGSDLYIAVSKKVPNAEMSELPGTFLTKVFEGPYKDMGKWIKEMKTYVKSQNKELKKMYFCYTTCPRCAKSYGKNYVILFAEI